jgi:hypothetical protein
LPPGAWRVCVRRWLTTCESQVQASRAHEPTSPRAPIQRSRRRASWRGATLFDLGSRRGAGGTGGVGNRVQTGSGGSDEIASSGRTLPSPFRGAADACHPPPHNPTVFPGLRHTTSHTQGSPDDLVHLIGIFPIHPLKLELNPNQSFRGRQLLKSVANTRPSASSANGPLALKPGLGTDSVRPSRASMMTKSSAGRYKRRRCPPNPLSFGGHLFRNGGSRCATWAAWTKIWLKF